MGAILEASERGVPTLVDGFICTVAALLAASISPWATRVMMFSTLSAERGHEVALNEDARQELHQVTGIPLNDISYEQGGEPNLRTHYNGGGERDGLRRHGQPGPVRAELGRYQP